eukprot:s1327_g17.t1
MYSRMGNELHEEDVEFATHEAFYEQYPKVADVLFIENVTEYPRSTVESNLGPRFAVEDVQVDPRNVGLGMGRARSFFLAYRKDKIKWNAEFSLSSFLECLSSKSDVHKARCVLPILCLWYSMPSDGLPHMQSWLGTAESILKGGFDSTREAIEVKVDKVPQRGVLEVGVTGKAWWLLDGLPKATNLCPLWYSILKMTGSKQILFLQRLFHLHDVQTRRAGRACITRLSQEQWASEIDLMCVQGYIYDNMVIAKNPKGEKEFSLDTLKKVELGILEGDFAEEAMEFLAVKDPSFKAGDASMWKDNASSSAEHDPAEKVHLEAADTKLESLGKDAKQKAWQHDSLSLARDVAAIAKMFQQVQKTDKAERLRRITHVRSENVIGASIISNHMEMHAKHLGGSETDLIHAVEQAGAISQIILHVCWA